MKTITAGSMAESLSAAAPEVQGAAEEHNKYRANVNYILRDIAGEQILVSVGSGIADFCGIVALNRSAGVLWGGLQQGATKAELTRLLTERFSVSAEQAAADVEKTLQLLLARGMVYCEQQ